MSRESKGILYRALPSAVGPTWMEGFRLACTGLTRWTTSAMTILSSTREYFVLTSTTSAAEILMSGCYNAGITVTALIYSGYADLGLWGNYTSPMQINFAPEGGFTAAFAAVLDPATQAFWDEITDVSGFAPPAKSLSVDGYYIGRPSMDCNIIEDSTKDYLALIITRTLSANTWYSDLHLMGSDIMDMTTNPEAPVNTWGVVGSITNYGGATPPTPLYYRGTAWDWMRTPYVSTGSTNPVMSLLKPETITVPKQVVTSSIPNFPTSPYQHQPLGCVDMDIMRSTSNAYTNFLGQIPLLGAADPTFLHLVKNELWPWDSTLTIPAP